MTVQGADQLPPSSSYELRMYSYHDTPDVDVDDTPTASQALLSGTRTPEPSHERKIPSVATAKAFYIRCLALMCAMSLSIGSHYASHMLGPLKSRLAREFGTDNTEFSLLISALSLNSTWTPLVGGLIASKLGTTYTSILATGVIFLGQLLLLIGDLTTDVRLMAFGIFVFGIATSPLSVVQETIIVRFFKSHGLGVSLAIGLVAGKGAAFVAAATSYPLTQHLGSHAPFVVAVLLTGLSVTINLIYVWAAKWLAEGSGAELEASDLRREAQSPGYNLSEAHALAKVAEKRRVYFRDITTLGDLFWAYLGLNVLYGTIWSPFAHLSSNIIEHRYSLTESEATSQASYLLAGSLVLYPICGYLVDRYKHRPIILQLLMASTCFSLFCYVWLALPPRWTGTAIPAIISFAVAHGFGPLLLVVIVPTIVPLKFVPTALGAHKSLESMGSTLFQTVAGWVLDIKMQKSHVQKNFSQSASAIQHLLNAFLFLNVSQVLAVIGFTWLDRRQRMWNERQKYSLLSSEEPPPPFEGDTGAPSTAAHSEQGQASWTDDRVNELEIPTASPAEHEELYVRSPSGGKWSRRSYEKRVKRAEIFAVISLALILCTWGLFLVTAVLRLRSKDERGGGQKPPPIAAR